MAEQVVNFEPVAEEVLLPSKGIYYKDKNKSLFDSKGKVLIRPMTLREEIMIKSPRVIKSGQFLNVLLRECIKTPNVDPLHMLSADRMFLFFYLRTISYGDEYSFSTSCPNCQKSNLYTVKLSELAIKYSQDTDLEPFEVEIRGKKVLLRQSRGFDEESVKKQTNVVTNAEKEDEEVDDSDIVDTYIGITIDIPGVSREQWRSFYETLSMKESSKLTTKIQEMEPGMKNQIKLRCQNKECKKVFEDRVPITANFFRVAGE